jgi:hypothetical protein
MPYLSQGGVADIASAALRVTEDPHLPEVTCQVLRLADLEAGKKPGPPCQKVSLKASPGRGIGLRHAVVPIRIAVKAREKPLYAFGFVAAVGLSLIAIGFALGRRRRAP